MRQMCSFNPLCIVFQAASPSAPKLRSHTEATPSHGVTQAQLRSQLEAQMIAGNQSRQNAASKTNVIRPTLTKTFSSPIRNGKEATTNGPAQSEHQALRQFKWWHVHGDSKLMKSGR